MPDDLDLDELKQALEDVRVSVHARFGDKAELADRLAQFDSHLATVSMVVDHLHDEAEKAGG